MKGMTNQQLDSLLESLKEVVSMKINEIVTNKEEAKELDEKIKEFIDKVKTSN